MSLAQLIRNAAAQSEQILAQMQGMEAGGTNVLYNGTSCVGVYGVPQVVFIPIVGGGYRKKTETRLTITRAQLTVAPIFNKKIVRTDLSPPVEYIIDHVGTQNPLSWDLVLRNFGE